MNLSIAQKYLSVLILIILLGSQLPTGSAFADDDPNKPVSDYWNSEKESDKGNKESELDNESPAADRIDEGAAVGSSVGDYIKVVFALVFVIGLLFGLLKFINRKNKLYDKTRLMKNTGGLSLGQHKSIQLVVIGGSYYLIGVGDDIRLLKEITDPDEISELVEFYEGESSETANGMLNRILMKIAGQQGNKKTVESEKTTEFGSLFQSSLDEMKEERKRHLSRLTEKERDRNE
jgi:flagellar protein FliO/FliZ